MSRCVFLKDHPVWCVENAPEVKMVDVGMVVTNLVMVVPWTGAARMSSLYFFLFPMSEQLEPGTTKPWPWRPQQRPVEWWSSDWEETWVPGAKLPTTKVFTLDCYVTLRKISLFFKWLDFVGSLYCISLIFTLTNTRVEVIAQRQCMERSERTQKHQHSRNE